MVIDHAMGNVNLVGATPVSTVLVVMEWLEDIHSRINSQGEDVWDQQNICCCFGWQGDTNKRMVPPRGINGAETPNGLIMVFTRLSEDKF